MRREGEEAMSDHDIRESIANVMHWHDSNGGKGSPAEHYRRLAMFAERALSDLATERALRADAETKAERLAEIFNRGMARVREERNAAESALRTMSMRVEEVQRERDAERAARIAAERERDEAREDAASLTRQLAQRTEMLSVANATNASQRERLTARAETAECERDEARASLRQRDAALRERWDAKVCDDASYDRDVATFQAAIRDLRARAETAERERDARPAISAEDAHTFRRLAAAPGPFNAEERAVYSRVDMALLRCAGRTLDADRADAHAESADPIAEGGLDLAGDGYCDVGATARDTAAATLSTLASLGDEVAIKMMIAERARALIAPALPEGT